MIRSKIKQNRFLKTLKLIFIVLTAVLMAIIWVGIFMQKKHMEELREKCTASVMGICVDVTSVQKEKVVKRENHNGHHKRVKTASYVEYTSKIEYTVDGVTYTISNSRSKSPKPAKDEEIKVMYDPNDPAKSYIP